MNRAAIRPILGRSDLLAGLDDDELTAVLTAASWRQIAAGVTLFSQADPPDYLYLVGSGLVKMSQIRPSGEQFTIRFMAPGDIIGCAAVLQQFPYPATAITEGDSVMLIWAASPFADLMTRYPQLTKNALGIVGNRALEFVERLGEGASKRVEQRIASAVLRLSRQNGKRCETGSGVEFSATRRDLAEMTGATYYTVSRTLSAWTKRGLIETSRRSMTVKAPHRLFEIAENV